MPSAFIWRALAPAARVADGWTAAAILEIGIIVVVPFRLWTKPAVHPAAGLLNLIGQFGSYSIRALPATAISERPESKRKRVGPFVTKGPDPHRGRAFGARG